VPLRFAVAALALPLLASACGGGGSKHAATTTTSTAPALTQAQFVQQANQVCIRSDRRVYNIGRLTSAPAGWLKTANAGRVGIAEMKTLNPPAAQQAQFKLMLSYAQQLVDAIQAVHDHLAKKQVQQAISAQFRAARFQDKTHAAAKTLGLTFCQQNLTNWPA
jgi:hypothetical protein